MKLNRIWFREPMAVVYYHTRNVHVERILGLGSYLVDGYSKFYDFQLVVFEFQWMYSDLEWVQDSRIFDEF